ncbi:MAG: cyanophycin synthetase [Planctomycetaceae bacterium]|nr:cyanophycin synthetase [Planctomycetaceae bacterium]
MDIRKIQALRGPNIWAEFPMLEVWVELSPGCSQVSHELPGLADRLAQWLPALVEHRGNVGRRGGFLEELAKGIPLAEVFEHVLLELLSQSGAAVTFSKTREDLGKHFYKVAVEYEEEDVAREAAKVALALVLAAADNRPFDVSAEIKRLRAQHEKICLGPSTKSIIRAAKTRGIPVRRLNEHSLIQLGYGSQQRRICAAQTDRTGAVAEEIAQDKDLTRALLKAAGVPVPHGRPVDNEEDAVEAAEDIGYPVVVKPQYGNQGRGVATNLQTPEQVIAAYKASSEESSYIIVEKFAPGSDYRLLVVGDRLIAAAKRDPAQVIGDGVHTINQLIDIVNQDPRRGDDHATALSKIKLDPVAMGVLNDQGVTPESVPLPGQKILIRRNANLSTGGSAADVTELVHPEVAARAIEAARVIGLDIAGVDVVATDVSIPLEDQHGVIVEVNASPGLRMHIEPSSGEPRPVGEAIISMMFGDGQNGRIPVVAVTGVNGKTTTTRFVANLLKLSGRRVGMTCTDGIFVDGRRIDTGDCSGPKSARCILSNPMVDAAVLETARGGILREGLGFDRCDVAVVTNIGGGDHLGIDGIETPEQLARVKRSIVEAVGPQGYAVLKADDPLTAAMAEQCKGHTIFFCRQDDHPVIAAHRALGNKCVFVRNNSIVAADGNAEEIILPLEKVTLTHGGRIAFQVENALAATAAAWALGLPRDTIRTGLQTFGCDMEKTPGRFNLFEIGGATVIVDYGHNPSSLEAMIEAMDNFPHQRRLAVYSAAGDRRDIDMIQQGEMLGEAFDRVIIYEDHYLRGRNPGEIIKLFKTGLDNGSRVEDVIEVVGSVKAVEAALRSAQAGDLLLIQADVIDETVDFMQKYLSSRQAEGRETSIAELLAGLSEALVTAGDKGRP